MSTFVDSRKLTLLHSPKEGGYRQQTVHISESIKPKPVLVSVITVVRNGESVLEQTIQSVLNQTYSNIEYIIIDGASTDRTIDIIRKYNDKIAYWLSEPDKGIADAWNKGIAVATGAIIGILNAGDCYDVACVQEVVNQLASNKPVISYGKTILVDESGNQLHVVAGQFNPRKLYKGIGFLHPSCFATKLVYEKVGIFQTSYRLAMDCDWLFRCYRQGIPLVKLNNVCYMQDGGASNQARFTAYGEYLQAMRNNGFSELQVRISMTLFGLEAVLRQIVKQILRKG